MMKIHIHKGLDLSLEGALPAGGSDIGTQARHHGIYAIVPDDYPGFVPRPVVREGDMVAAGTPLMCDKRFGSLTLVSPVGGKVKAIVRGERRRLIRIEVEACDSTAGQPQFDLSDKDNLRRFLAQSGLMAMMRQRPYDIVPNPEATVRDIFVMAFDSAPLASEMLGGLKDVSRYLDKGVEILSTLTKGKVYIAHRGDLPQIEGAEMVEVTGPHPAGLPGSIISAVAPINKGETVWTLTADTLYKIGQLAETGRTDTSCRVAVTGSAAKERKTVVSAWGASVASILGPIAGSDRHLRIISGNVLTGTAVGDGPESFLRYPYRQITVIPEGDDVDEFMGWASMAPSKMSVNPSFPGKFLARFKKKFSPDARLCGGARAMIMSGGMDKVMPIDILPEYLVKAILARDIDRMEALGIYEVAPEDFALAEYADPSKMPLQKIVRDGLDYLRKETE